jgi:hypothetical protein
MANIITELHLEMSDNWYVSKKLNSVGRVGENTVTKLIIEPTEILDNVTYEIEIADASGSKNVAELTIDGTELYLILTANMLTVSGIMKMQVRGLFTDGSIKKSNIFELKVNRSISATEHYEEYAVTIFDQLVNECRDIIEGAESYAIRAETAAVNAEAYEQSASASAEAASASEATATSASTAAVNAAASAETSANTASTSAETATTAANSASASASNASTSAQTAQSASVTAQSASEVAQTASTTATTAATNAETAANTATTAANNASASATSAAADATNAAISEANASTSAANAHTSEANAANSATAASTSAANANTSATNAANSATSAATSATNAHNSEVNASTSETNAGASATEAAASAESIAESVAQINENTYRINDLEAIIAGYQLADLPTGAIATVADGTALLMPSLKVGIEPVQDLHGYDHPWAGGAGKNLFNIDAEHTVVNEIYMYEVYAKPNTSYTLSSNCPFSSPANLYFNGGSTEVNGVGLDYPKTFNSDEDGKLVIYVRYKANVASIDLYTAVKNGQYYIQLEQGSTVTTYSPYSNICPISGWSEANVVVSPTTSAEDGTTYTIEFRDGDNPLTVYGGTLNVTSGELTVTDAHIASYSGETLPSTWISDRDVYAEGATPTTGAEVVYKLANSVTYHLTPTQIRTLVGNNNIWADTGDIIEGKYFKSLT